MKTQKTAEKDIFNNNDSKQQSKRHQLLSRDRFQIQEEAPTIADSPLRFSFNKPHHSLRSLCPHQNQRLVSSTSKMLSPHPTPIIAARTFRFLHPDPACSSFSKTSLLASLRSWTA